MGRAFLALVFRLGGGVGRICVGLNDGGVGAGLIAHDSSLSIMILGAGVLRRACQVLGLSYGIEPFYEGISGARKQTPAGDALEVALVEYLSSRDSVEAEAIFQDAGIPCSRVNTFAMCESDAQFVQRKTFTSWRNAYENGETMGVNVVPRLTRNPGKISRGMPLVGQDNEEILASLGVDSWR